MKTILLKQLNCVLTFAVLLSANSVRAQNIDFGKSYINVTKGINGGTLETGDTLEIRAAFVVRSGTYDSCGYFDATPAGTTYIPNTIRVLTNEGKIYKQFSDVHGDDEGWRNGSNIRINLGYRQNSNPARWYRRGRVANTHRPSNWGSTCIMIASFRVRVTASVGSLISTGGGYVTYKSGSSPIQTYTFPANRVAVYRNMGICSNAIGTNSLGTEFNGTFGSGKTRNRTASANVPPSYTYNIFANNSPQDYYYGIANNTSIRTGYTTLNTWLKPDASRRVFGVWDIIGDHTGAADPIMGNPAADTVANDNGGYMLVINASYRIDSAFQQTISNLCPNTYYEISCWIRNICSRCGCDSAGRGAGSTGYIPTAPGDSAGVDPNLTFEVDGIDYYTTGNIQYTGKWVKKGFTFLTGPTQTSFTLKFFNNAPGGGGNDWALDDISVATCGPNLNFTPTNDPVVCEGNVVDLGCYVNSFFDNYTQYKWQLSTNNGASWTDVGAPASATPSAVAGGYEYFVTYPGFIADASDSGNLYRVVVATTPANINSSSCAFSETGSVVTLNVIDCGVPLDIDLLSFTGKLENNYASLNWTVSNCTEPVNYIIEKSLNGYQFTVAGNIVSEETGSGLRQYNWIDMNFQGNAYYRLRMKGTDKQKLSKTIRISGENRGLTILKLPNPFKEQLQTEIYNNKQQQLEIILMDYSGNMVRRKSMNLNSGIHSISMETGSLPNGIYTLRITNGTEMIHHRVMKL